MSTMQKAVCLFLVAIILSMNSPTSVWGEDSEGGSGSSVVQNPVSETQSGVEVLPDDLPIELHVIQSGSVVAESGSLLSETGSVLSSNQKKSEEAFPVPDLLIEEDKKPDTKAKQRLQKTNVRFKQHLSLEKKEKLLLQAERVKTKAANKANIQSKISTYKQQKQALREQLKNKQREKGKEGKQQKRANTKNSLTLEANKAELKQRREFLKEINDLLKSELDAAMEEELTAEEQELIEIEPNYLFELQNESLLDKGDLEGFLPNDTEYENQWGLQSISVSFEKGDTEGSTNSASPLIALIDTGVDYNHEDLQGQFWNAESCVDDLNEEVAGGCLNGGYDFVDEDSDPFASDGYAHATQVSGILGAKTNNELGIASLTNNNVQLMALRVADEGILELENIIRAVYFAVNNGADIINMSFGGPTYSENLKEAIAYAESQGVVVVAAAGNYGSNNDITPIYPASYDLNNIISVAALDQNDVLAEFSNYGVNSVDIAAPGVNVLSTGLNDSYSTVSGTSFAVPFVVGSYVYYVGVVREFVGDLASF